MEEKREREREKVTEEEKKEICAEAVEPLLNWYQKSHTNLPWREDPTPYHIWLSEIMLQQTRIEAVRPYYARFLEVFPDVAALAVADDDRLMKLWEGLGYYSRARNLKKAAVMLCERYGGEMPQDVDGIRALPGVGDYTAGAIASIAFGLPEPAVDGNVLRVLTRLTGDCGDITKPDTKKRIKAWLSAVYPTNHSAAMTQALMELGERVCIPNGEAHCGDCPWQGLCVANRENRTGELPVRTKKKARKIEERTVFLLCCGDRIALRKRPCAGLLAGLWEFPNCPGRLTAEEAAAHVAHLSPRLCEPAGNATHIFTHLEWHMTGYLFDCLPSKSEEAQLVWVTREELRSTYAIASALRHYVQFAQNRWQ